MFGPIELKCIIEGRKMEQVQSSRFISIHSKRPFHTVSRVSPEEMKKHLTEMTKFRIHTKIADSPSAFVRNVF